jgi:hypothetical protein
MRGISYFHHYNPQRNALSIPRRRGETTESTKGRLRPTRSKIRAFTAKDRFFAVVFRLDKLSVVAGFWSTPGAGISSRLTSAVDLRAMALISGNFLSILLTNYRDLHHHPPTPAATKITVAAILAIALFTIFSIALFAFFSNSPPALFPHRKFSSGTSFPKYSHSGPQPSCTSQSKYPLPTLSKFPSNSS